MMVYIVMENSDTFGATARDAGEIVHGVFFDRRRAEDFVRGMVGYVSSYEEQKLSFVAGNAITEDDAILFQIVEKEAICG